MKQVIIGGYDKKDKADPKQVTFVLKNDSKINYEDYLQATRLMKKIYRWATTHCEVVTVLNLKQSTEISKKLI